MKSITIPGLDRPVSNLIMGPDFFTPEEIDYAADLLDTFVEIGGNTIQPWPTPFGASMQIMV